MGEAVKAFFTHFHKAMKERYPEGVDQLQHVELCRVFLRGYTSGLIAGGNTSAATLVKASCMEIDNPSWQPSKMWKWW